MAKLIFISPYLKGGSNAAKLSNLVKYISTRDGVRTVHDAGLHLAPTKKQKECIQELTELFPEAKQLAEYETYRLSPSQHSAAELIEQIEETFASELNKRENFVAYIAKRPGVRRIGSHGLWNADGQIPVMQTVIDEVAQHKGNVWTPIISLPREDAERLGFDNIENWQNLIRASTIHIAEGYKIKPDHLRWYAAMHEKEKHIHVHMIIFSADAKEGFLTKEGIRQIKSSLVRQIYKDDLLNIYQEQTKRRTHLQENASKVMRSLIRNMQDGELNSPQLEMLIAELADRLQSFSGKKVYGYLPPATKRIVDAVVDELARDPRVAEAYSLWQDMRDEVFSFYSRTKPERVPLSQQKEFKVVRNMVIREVVHMLEEHHTETIVKDHSRQTPGSESDRNNSSRQQYPVAECMIRMLHHMGNIFRDNTGTIEYRGLHLDKKRRKELQEWKIALGHREDDHEDPENYPKSAY